MRLYGRTARTTPLDSAGKARVGRGVTSDGYFSVDMGWSYVRIEMVEARPGMLVPASSLNVGWSFEMWAEVSPGVWGYVRTPGLVPLSVRIDAEHGDTSTAPMLVLELRASYLPADHPLGRPTRTGVITRLTDVPPPEVTPPL